MPRTTEDVSPFAARIYAALQAIPAGSVITYAALGRRVGCGSPRAVGQALRANPVAPTVPCHRVIAADLSPGGFFGESNGPEIARKLRLLSAEGVHFANNRLTEEHRLIR